ncbi:hypothetical protein [Paenibacillus ehimensis]|uniref:Uncharacterized protein n=1 Tax=Paenibacillus ehimensis TaxID=79264 RepID=A0ABT8V6W9_9BACL|nr:hypothetical protein [Paenibacillus ehimensis]MDO3677187.1 hypothetical protein [Paenibacillus ehimensis]MEC0212911.1 hypothetical protein [Paenibacillus ehimensis]
MIKVLENLAAAAMTTAIVTLLLHAPFVNGRPLIDMIRILFS